MSLVRPCRPPWLVTLEAEPDPVQVDLACRAMVIVDMQNDFLDSTGWFASVRGAKRFKKAIALVVSAAELPRTPAIEEIYSDAFLPASDERIYQLL